METIDILREARTYIEKGWTQKAYARTLSGRTVNCQSSEAVSFCSIGGICHVKVPANESAPAISALAKAIPLDLGNFGETLVRWNDADERTKDEVLAAFDVAIEGLTTLKS